MNFAVGDKVVLPSGRVGVIKMLDVRRKDGSIHGHMIKTNRHMVVILSHQLRKL